MATSRKKTPAAEGAEGVVLEQADTARAVEAAPKSVPAGGKASGHTAGFCVYIGPSIVGVVQRGTIYRGDKPEVLASLAGAVEKYPLIASLVVPGDTLPVDRIKVKTPGNLLYVNYHKLAAGKK